MYRFRWRLKWQRWTRHGSGFYWLVPLGLAVLGMVLFVLAEWNLKSPLLAMAEVRGVALATEAINEAIRHRVANDANFRDLVFYKTDQQGRIVLLQPNTLRINQLAAETTLDVQQALAGLQETTLAIPMGQMLGTRLLASLGPNIYVRILPIGSVRVKPVELFEEAGINQTKHMVFLDVEAVVRIVVPMVTAEMPVCTRVAIATTIISGAVPNVYLRGETPVKPVVDVEKTS
ncbi:MAG: sporulation protein YunB [Heliobacteriaceae bacterium]|nr:sporulation protein YunB [Heliobacteriaceae bacterium]MDD4587553.1 sporulation protein YunB [Heliobacteriaceae bacterium]